MGIDDVKKWWNEKQAQRKEEQAIYKGAYKEHYSTAKRKALREQAIKDAVARARQDAQRRSPYSRLAAGYRAAQVRSAQNARMRPVGVSPFSGASAALNRSVFDAPTIPVRPRHKKRKAAQVIVIRG